MREVTRCCSHGPGFDSRSLEGSRFSSGTESGGVHPLHSSAQKNTGESQGGLYGLFSGASTHPPPEDWIKGMYYREAESSQGPDVGSPLSLGARP